MNPDDASTKLMQACRPHLLRVQRPWQVAIAGLPGSGKSTLAGQLVRLAESQGMPALALSLDDFYLPRRARQLLARHVHPLLATRGVPGTHDLALLHHLLDQLASAATQYPLAVPRFDKGCDTRHSPSRWPQLKQAPKLVVLEGWCLGIRAQSDAQLETPINTLERKHDADGHWRRWVNHQLQAYLPLWRHADLRVEIRSPCWAATCKHRWLAEQARLQRKAPQAMDRQRLKRFLQHYERLGRHALATGLEDVDMRFDNRDLFA